MRLRKALSTVRLMMSMGLARTFGEYVNSGWNGDFEYHRYRWRGEEWVIPSGPVKTLEG